MAAVAIADSVKTRALNDAASTPRVRAAVSEPRSEYLITGLTVGATYALAALGFSIVYNASHVINFAQGEFIMLGGMIAAALASAGAPVLVAVLAAIGSTAMIGYVVGKLAIQPARDSDVTTLMIITIGVSMVLRGAVAATLGKGLLATAYNRLAAELVGVDARHVVSLSFVLSAAIGAIGGATDHVLTWLWPAH